MDKANTPSSRSAVRGAPPIALSAFLVQAAAVQAVLVTMKILDDSQDGQLVNRMSDLEDGRRIGTRQTEDDRRCGSWECTALPFLLKPSK